MYFSVAMRHARRDVSRCVASSYLVALRSNPSLAQLRDRGTFFACQGRGRLQERDRARRRRQLQRVWHALQRLDAAASRCVAGEPGPHDLDATSRRVAGRIRSHAIGDLLIRVAKYRAKTALPLLILPPLIVLVVGLAVAVGIGIVGLDALARASDERAASAAETLAATMAVRLSRLPPPGAAAGGSRAVSLGRALQLAARRTGAGAPPRRVRERRAPRPRASAPPAATPCAR